MPVLLVALLLLPVPSQELQRTELRVDLDRSVERFKLFNNCKPMFLQIVYSSDGTYPITKEQIHHALERRLRLARLFAVTPDDLGQPHGNDPLSRFDAIEIKTVLLVVAGINNKEIHIRFSYRKPVLDIISGQVHLADTLSYSAQFPANLAQTWLSNEMDQFLTDYLRVNEASCD